jgi:two-component system, response regulator PdtaR
MATSTGMVVLVVEDEPLLVLLAEEVVRSAGFEPVFAWHADEALRLLEERNDIRVVFTDVDMPGAIDGMELAATVRRRWPSMEIIVVSGRPAAHLSRLPERVRFFSKPYPFDKIVSALRGLRS